MRRSRIEREKHTAGQMIRLYCRLQRHDGPLCPECSALLEYSLRRLDKCPFQNRKTVCARCKVHCFKPGLRDNIKAVMRYAGPRMLWHHPAAAIQYLFDKRRREPLPPDASRS